MIEGIQSHFTHARDTVVGLGQNIKTWFEQTLGIHSPSRVFLGFGENIGMGAEIGMQNRIASVRRSALQLAHAAIQGIALHGAATDTIPCGRHAPGGTAAGEASAAPVIHFSPTIHVTGGDNAQTQVRTALQDAYREFERMMQR